MARRAAVVLLALFLTLAARLSAAEPAPAAAAPGLWLEDFEAAKAKAAKEGKDLLIDFTGSDWCVWCKTLRQEVFDQDEFKKKAPAKFILLELDFPNAKPQSDAVKAQNAKLQAQFNVGGFPSVILTDAKGVP